MLLSIAIATACVLAAAGLHHAIARASRRIPRWLVQRRGGAVGPMLPWDRSFAIARLALQAVLWTVVTVVLARRFPSLAGGARVAFDAVRRSLSAPLFTLDGKLYSALDLLALPALLVGVWIAVSNTARLVQTRIFGAAGIAGGVQDTLGVLLRYGLAFVAAVVVLQFWGIDVRSVAILASVVGVGIGFGLQTIANNFVSGLLINLERPIRAGDFVNVGPFAGTVVRVGARSTEVRTLDEVTILVPNARFLETEVINWSHGDPRSRIHVPIGVAYGSDLARARQALLEAARAHPRVLRDPRPQVQFRRFGDSAIELELLVWTREPREQFSLISDLNFRIAESLVRHGLQIPFPQRDLHLRSPSLDRIVDALARTADHESGEARRAQAFTTGRGDPAGSAPTGDGPQPPGRGLEAVDGSFDAALDAALNRVDLEAIATRLRGAGGVEIADRRYRLSVYPRTFVGRKAVDWLAEHEGLTRSEAVVIGQRMVAAGLLHHVLDEHGFQDEDYFYRFRADDPS